MVKSSKKERQICIICGATDNLKLHPSFGRNGKLLCPTAIALPTIIYHRNRDR